MTTSESIKSISTALVAFHKEVGKIAKGSTNPFFKSKYASLSDILDAISEPLVNSGLSVVQFPEGENVLTTRLVHISGEWMEAAYSMKPVKDTPQDRGSAITYQRRYAIGAILSLNIDEDDDANRASARAYVNASNKAVPAASKRQHISDKAFGDALARIDKGEVLLIGKLEQTYELTSEQKSVLEERKVPA
jgi:hypothetical protein